MSLRRALLAGLARALTDALFRVHAEALAGVPARGPLILAMNHVQFWEVPLIYARLYPREVHGLVLDTRWKNPALAWILNTAGAIPLKRGGVNLGSLNQALACLQAGEMVMIMPEGTRSHDGRLGTAHPGVLALALKSQAPIMPIVTFGGERYPEQLKRLRRTDIYIRVGQAFTMKEGGAQGAIDAAARTRMLDELMYRMAALLPDQYRGAYAS